MMTNFRTFLKLLILIALPAISALPADLASCNNTFTSCSIRENVLLQLPFEGIAGDVIVQEPNSTNVSDVFRIFNNIVDTGGGTGLGNMAFLYSGGDSAALPDPSTYSANAVVVKEAASGPTAYLGNGTTYSLDTAAVATRLVYTGATVALFHATTQLAAVLTAVSGAAALPNATVKFTLGSQTCSAPTNGSGMASCSLILNQAAGNYTVITSFSGIFGADAGTSISTPFDITLGASQVKAPTGVAVTAAGPVLVSDTGDDRINEYSPTGSYITQLGSPGSLPGQLRQPGGLAVGPDGSIYVADGGNNRIGIFTSSNTFKQELTSPTLPFAAPAAVAVDGSNGASRGHVVVADTGNSRVQVFNTAGVLLFVISSAGVQPLNHPAAVAVDAAGNILIADTGNSRVVGFTSGGSLKLQFGTSGFGPGQLSHPAGIAVAAGGNIVVADTGNNRLETFSATGSPISQIGAKGIGPGQFQQPSGLAIAANGNILVCNTGNNRIEVFNAAGVYQFEFGQ